MKKLLQGMKLQPIFNRHFREREREYGGIICKEITDENFSEFEKINLQIKGTLLVLNWINEKKSIDFKTEKETI